MKRNNFLRCPPLVNKISLGTPKLKLLKVIEVTHAPTQNGKDLSKQQKT